MGVTWRGSKRSMTMRSPLYRALVAALCVLVFMAIFRRESMSVGTELLGQAGIKAKTVHPQKPLEGSGLPHAVTGDDDTKGISSNFNLNCTADLPYLRKIRQKYNLDKRFQYMKRYIRFTRVEGLERKRMTQIPENLLNGAFRTIDVNKQYEQQNSCEKPLAVQVPASGLPSSVNASDFMFGVSTTLKRFMDPETTPINEWIFWLTDSRGHSNGAKLVLMVLDASDDELQEVANLLGDVGIDVDVYHSDSSLEMAVRYVSLVPVLYSHPDARKKKWLVTCDDDTFFPSMHGLMEKLSKFDHTRDMYIGTLSEDVNAVERHGSQAFGGAGVFLSVPLAQKIAQLYGSCTTEQKIHEANTGWGPQGDILLRKCIYENTDTRLTNLWDLWQLDIVGHPAGFYEWGIKPLSLHHYHSSGWHKAKPDMYSKIAHTCGEDCTLMRFQTKDDFIISGYSIAHYPEGVTFDTNQVEATLHPAPEDKGWNLDFVLGPMRSNLERTGKKIAWELQESEVQSDGSVLQTYTRKQNDERWVHSDGQPMSNIDGVMELVWIPS